MREFAAFRLDTVNQCLWRGEGVAEERILVAPKAFAVLRYLVEHPGRLVPHAELLDAVWPKTYVQPEVLKSHIADVRTLLGDDTRKPIFIETLPRRGYRFIAPVTEGAPARRAAVSGSAKVLVGRDGPLAELHQCLRRMSNGERQTVFVTGEAGIGKTAVADAFLDRTASEVSDIRIARGQCIEGYGSKEAYYPMLEALAGLCRGEGGDAIVEVLAAQAPTWLVQFPTLLTPERSDGLRREVLGATRERMLREIGEALEAIASRSPSREPRPPWTPIRTNSRRCVSGWRAAPTFSVRRRSRSSRTGRSRHSTNSPTISTVKCCTAGSRRATERGYTDRLPNGRRPPSRST
jgi:DNA-binding winged helix-turn-helix (wHTH) protein